MRACAARVWPRGRNINVRISISFCDDDDNNDDDG